MKKNSVRKPSGRRSSHDLSCQSLTTANLFSVKPLFSRVTVPNDHFSISTSQINRVDSLPVSSFVKISNKLAWFYVKNCQVWKPWDCFINKVPYAFNGLNNLVSEVPFVNPFDLYAVFDGASPFGLSTKQNILSEVQNYDDVVRIYNDHRFDFVFYQFSNGTPQSVVGVKLNYAGRLVYDILYSLGYRIPKIITNDYSAQNLSLAGVHMSLLPLMSYLSVLVNYYVPVKFRDYSFVNSFSYQITPYDFHFGSFASFSSSQPAHANVIGYWANVIKLLSEVFYGSDYFTDSLVQPYKAITGAPTVTQLFDPANNENMRVTDSTGQPMLVGHLENDDPTNDFFISQYILNALKALSSKDQIAAMTRNDIVGASLAMFGVKPDAADMVPYLLSHRGYNTYVTPEVATADTYSVDSQGNASGAPLGYKAGRGEGVLTDYKTKFDFDAYGLLFCISSITPDTFNIDGLNREMMYTQHRLIYDPNFVGLGYQAIGNIEVQTTEMLQGSTDLLTDTFGFQNSYAELGYRRDFMGGDFVINSRNNGLDAFHFARKVVPQLLQNDARYALAKSVGSAPFSEVGDGDQFSRIFIDMNAQNDHFQQWTIFDINADRDIPFNGEFTLGDEDDGKVQEVGRPSEVLNS